MKPVEILHQLKAFDIPGSSLSLWVFKNSSSKAANFKAHAVIATPALTTVLKQIAENTLANYIEIEPYALLAQPNEVGCLCLETDETIFPELQKVIDAPPEEHLIQNLRQIENSTGYVVRLQGNTQVLYCIKRLAQNWRTTKRMSVVNTVLNGNQLDVVPDDTFTIAKNFDFFGLGS